MRGAGWCTEDWRSDGARVRYGAGAKDWSGRHWNGMLYTSCFPKGIAPASPIHTKPVKTFNARLRLEFDFSKRLAAVRLCGSFDFLENVQFGHRGNLSYTALILSSTNFIEGGPLSKPRRGLNAMFRDSLWRNRQQMQPPYRSRGMLSTCSEPDISLWTFSIRDTTLDPTNLEKQNTPAVSNEEQQ